MTLRNAVAVARYQSRVLGWRWFLLLVLAATAFCRMPWIPALERYAFASTAMVVGSLVPSLMSLGSGRCLRLLPVSASLIASIRWLVVLAATLACAAPLFALGRIPIGSGALIPANEACLACIAPVIALWMNLSLPWTMRSPVALMANATVVFIILGFAGILNPDLLTQEGAVGLPAMLGLALAASVAGLAWAALIEPRLGLLPWNTPPEHARSASSSQREALSPLGPATTPGPPSAATPSRWLGPSARLCLRATLTNPMVIALYAATAVMCFMARGPLAGVGMLMAMPCVWFSGWMTIIVQQLMLGGRVAPRKALATYLIAGPSVMVAILLGTIARPFPLAGDSVRVTALTPDPYNYLLEAFPARSVRLADGSLVPCAQFADDCRKRQLIVSRAFLQQQLVLIIARDEHIDLDTRDITWLSGKDGGGGGAGASSSPLVNGDEVVTLTGSGIAHVLARKRLESALLVLAAAFIGLLLPTLLMEGRRPHSRLTKATFVAGLWLWPVVAMLAFPYVTGPSMAVAVSGSLPMVTVGWWPRVLIAIENHPWCSVAVLLIGTLCVLALGFSRVRYLPRIADNRA